MAQLLNSLGKPEFHDGVDWFALASENWVTNLINKIPPCLVATTANLQSVYNQGTGGVGATLTNTGSQAAIAIDGVTLTVGSRILVKDQTNDSHNGVYQVTNTGSSTTSWVLTRVVDFDSVAQMSRGMLIKVINGTLNSASAWMLTSIITSIGTSSILFAKLNASGGGILGTTDQIVVTLVNNIATISIAPNPILPGTGSVTIPNGTTAQRPSTPTLGMVRLNTDL